MVLIASGKADVYWEVGPHIWDVAAGIVIIREAGGVVFGVGENKEATSENSVKNQKNGGVSREELVLDDQHVDVCGRKFLCIRPGVQDPKALANDLLKCVEAMEVVRD